MSRRLYLGAADVASAVAGGLVGLIVVLAVAEAVLRGRGAE